MNGAGHQLFPGPAFAGDQDPAGLRCNGFNQFEQAAHLRAGADDVIEPGKLAQLAAKLARFFLDRLIFGDAPHGRAQFIEQPVALDDVAICAKVNGVDGGIHGGNAGNQDKGRRGRDFLGILQQFDAVHVRHADIGNHDIENLAGQTALGSLSV